MRLRTAALHLLVLWSFAVAQPLFDLLGKNGEFFAARGSTRWDVILFSFVVLFGPPALLLAIEAVFPQVHPVFVAALTALFVLQAVKGAGGPSWLLVALAVGVGVGGAVLYTRVAGARLALTVLAPTPFLFLALFLFNSDASRLSFSTEAANAAGERPRASAVLIAFDELPVNSLLDSRGRIDAARFPNFARLAAGSTWFANTSTVGEGTTHAVPAILTGRFPRAGELPVFTDHRQNLFTLLGGTADLHVLDEETHLCPPRLCPGLEGSFGGRMTTLAEDTGVVYLHQLLPSDLADGVPSISNGWDNFIRDESAHHDPGRIAPSFMASLKPEPGPALWFLHVMLPHSPWNYLPSGRRYSIRSAPGWGPDEVWPDNQAAVDQYWQRHLLQLGYADRVLGQLLNRLRSSGLYNRALVIVTADHGVSFRAGEKRRPLSEANLQDIAWVPLFVKLPHNRRGRVVQRPARTIDVMPTIAGVLGTRIPWPVDGQNLLSPSRPERNVVLIKDHGQRFVVPAAALEAKREAALSRQLALFGSNEPASTLYAIGPFRSMLGHKLAGGHRVDVDFSTDPVQVSGQTDAANVALISGGRVVAVVPATEGQFWALVPRASIKRRSLRMKPLGARPRPRKDGRRSSL